MFLRQFNCASVGKQINFDSLTKLLLRGLDILFQNLSTRTLTASTTEPVKRYQATVDRSPISEFNLLISYEFVFLSH